MHFNKQHYTVLKIIIKSQKRHINLNEFPHPFFLSSTVHLLLMAFYKQWVLHSCVPFAYKNFLNNSFRLVQVTYSSEQ